MHADDDKEMWLDKLLDDVGDAPAADTPADLMARVLEDALAAQPAPGAVMATPVSLWRQMLEGLGGWMSVGGLVAATATGFAIGLGALGGEPSDLYWMTGLDMFYDTDIGLTAYGWDLEEG